jgi:hypothetical protein
MMPAALDAAVEAGAVVQRKEQRPAQQFFEIFAREVQPPSPQDDVPNPETPPDEVIERHAHHRQVPPVFAGRKSNRPILQGRIVARKRV